MFTQNVRTPKRRLFFSKRMLPLDVWRKIWLSSAPICPVIFLLSSEFIGKSDRSFPVEVLATYENSATSGNLKVMLLVVASICANSIRHSSIVTEAVLL